MQETRSQVETLKPALPEETSPLSDLPRGNTAPLSDERKHSLGLRVLKDWIINMQNLGVPIEIYDMRPDEDAFAVVIRGDCYHAECHEISVGSVCGNCGKSVVAG